MQERRTLAYTLYMQLSENKPDALARCPRIDPELWDCYGGRNQEHFISVARFHATSLQEAWSIVEPCEGEGPADWLGHPGIQFLESEVTINRTPLPGDVLKQGGTGYMRRSARTENRFWSLDLDQRGPEPLIDSYQYEPNKEG